MLIIYHILIKYMLFVHDLLPLNIVYIVLENDNNVLENNISLAVGTMTRWRIWLAES